MANWEADGPPTGPPQPPVPVAAARMSPPRWASPRPAQSPTRTAASPPPRPSFVSSPLPASRSVPLVESPENSVEDWSPLPAAARAAAAAAVGLSVQLTEPGKIGIKFVAAAAGGGAVVHTVHLGSQSSRQAGLVAGLHLQVQGPSGFCTDDPEQFVLSFTGLFRRSSSRRARGCRSGPRHSSRSSTCSDRAPARSACTSCQPPPSPLARRRLGRRARSPRGGAGRWSRRRRGALFSRRGSCARWRRRGRSRPRSTVPQPKSGRSGSCRCRPTPFWTTGQLHLDRRPLGQVHLDRRPSPCCLPRRSLRPPQPGLWLMPRPSSPDLIATSPPLHLAAVLFSPSAAFATLPVQPVTHPPTLTPRNWARRSWRRRRPRWSRSRSGTPRRPRQLRSSGRGRGRRRRRGRQSGRRRRRGSGPSGRRPS